MILKLGEQGKASFSTSRWASKLRCHRSRMCPNGYWLRKSGNFQWLNKLMRFTSQFRVGIQATLKLAQVAPRIRMLRRFPNQERCNSVLGTWCRRTRHKRTDWQMLSICSRANYEHVQSIYTRSLHYLTNFPPARFVPRILISL